MVRTAVVRIAGVALALGMVLTVGGCGQKGTTVAKGNDQYYGSNVPASVPPLKGEGFSFGKPPDLQASLGNAKIGVSPSGWMWPQDANEIRMANVGWPPKLGNPLEAHDGDLVKFFVPGVTFKPAAVDLTVIPRSYYMSKSWPDHPAQEETSYSFDVKKEVKVSAEGVSFEWKIEKVQPGDWVFVVRPRWDAPIGGDALYLVPVAMK